MPTSIKKPVKKQPKNKVTHSKQRKVSEPERRTRIQRLMRLQLTWRRRTAALLLRRPHRSFHRTRRRDYARSLQLPSYWSFTGQVRKILWQHKTLFLWVTILYAVLSGTLVGLASQDTYTQLGDVLKQQSGDILQGNWGEIGKAGILLGTGILGGINQTPTDAQKIFAPLVTLLIWLSTIWLLRALLAGHKPKLRDGLYNAGAPIISTFLVSLMFLVQLIPAAIATLGFWAATQTGFITDGVEAMAFWIVASLLVILSLYWVTSTFIAMIVVTLPGMYPMQALRTAGDMVVGRRLRILLRLLWLFVLVAIIWVVVMIPVILIDTWLKSVWTNISWVPIVPVGLLIMSSLTVVWSSSYIYLLYRKIVDDDASPA